MDPTVSKIRYLHSLEGETMLKCWRSQSKVVQDNHDDVDDVSYRLPFKLGLFGAIAGLPDGGGGRGRLGRENKNFKLLF